MRAEQEKEAESPLKGPGFTHNKKRVPFLETV